MPDAVIVCSEHCKIIQEHFKHLQKSMGTELAKKASYDSATFKVTELFSTTHSTATGQFMKSVRLWRLPGYVLAFI